MNLGGGQLGNTQSMMPSSGDSSVPDQFPAGLRVLLVDADITALSILEKMLRRCNYEVTKCYKAEVALSLLRENRSGFDVVISEVHMPDMDGFKLLEHIGLEMDLPVIMMSADDSKSVVLKGIIHGACDYLIKPVRMEAVRNIWQHVVRKRKHQYKDFDQSASADVQKQPEKSDYSYSANEGHNWKNTKGGKDEDDEADKSDESSSLKRPRVVWTVELHQEFVKVVNQLGIDKAGPKKILALMNDVPGLTREHVASHLQKYRLYLRRLEGPQHPRGMNRGYLSGPDSGFGLLSSLNELGHQALAASGQLAQLPPPSFATLQPAPLGIEIWEHLKIPLPEIKEATNYFQKCIGKGGYGLLYEGKLRINGSYTKVAVKRYTTEYGQGMQEFLTELQMLTSQKHENLINLVGYCDDGKEMIIVLENAEHGTLDQYIRCSNTSYTLSWLERLKIVVGAACGIDHLHNNAGVHQAIIHRDIKSKNICLVDKWVAKISNFGLSVSCFSGSSQSMVISVPCGTPGYTEPEYIRTGIVETKTDVYSFGMVLFEVLCGRLCNHREEDGTLLSADLVKEYYNEDKLDRIFDPIIKEQMSLNSLSRYSAIAYKCLLPRQHRPLINVVKKELEEMLHLEMQEVMAGRLESNSILCKEDDVYLRKKLPIQRFSLAEIKNAIDECADEKLLGEGAFGKVYHANISGKEVAVKLMRKNMEPEQGIPAFQKEIDLLSGCDHVNIISLVGYCDEEDEKILVYEFMPNGSLFDYLFSQPDVAQRLTVEQRLEICIGVAKGLSYLHSGTHFNIIHSDVKTENILLDSSLVPKLSDFGLSRTREVGPSTSKVVTNHIQGTEGYLAPECYEPNYKLSRKADVYAFGVVLLEVLCERPPWKRLLVFALPYIMRGELHMLTPQHVKTSITPECLRKCESQIWRCLEIDPDKRPVMSEVVDQLEFALKLQKQNQK